MAVLNHQEPDRIPIDFGSPYASINVKAYGELKNYLGVKSKTKIMRRGAQNVIVDDEILEMFDIDTRTVSLPKSSEIPPYLEDKWGVSYKYSKETAAYIAYRGPFQAKKRPTCRDLEEYDWPNPSDLAQISEELKEKARKLHEESDYAVMLPLPLGVVHMCQFLRGYCEWLQDLIINSEFAEELMDRVAAIWIGTTRRMLDALGSYIDIVTTGDDLGTQDSTLVSPNMYRKLIKSRHKKMMDAVKAESNVKILCHSCGSVYPFIEDFIELGIDALNPVQVSAKDMDPVKLKAKAGNKLAFWGAIDTQHVLPYGTTKDVRNEVKRMIAQLGPGGGYVLAPVHTVQYGVPPENIAAMFKASLQYGKYQ